MLAVLRLISRAIELALAVPLRLLPLVGRLLALPFHAVRHLLVAVSFNRKLGPLRHVATAAIAYLAFALVLVYVVAPIRGYVGSYYLADKLRYDAERWLATAIYDNRGNFIGSFDPRLDSRRDVNYTDAAIELGDYTALPDHKSVPVNEVPEHYWRCLAFHEDRNIGTWINPFGIDLYGVLKIPYTSIRRSIALRRPSLGVGGSTLPMQLVRVIDKTPPDASHGVFAKLSRKFREWWLAPVIYRELTRDGDDTPLKRWAANHLWLAQRTGGSSLHGVEITSQIVFGKDAKDLTVAEQFVLASAVNKPIILLSGDEKLNEVRIDRWRYITEVRARTCAEKLVSDPELQKATIFELVQLAGGPPDPKAKPLLRATLVAHTPALAARAVANPFIRANALLPAARFGIREEMKQSWGFGWRDYVRGVTVTLDVAENLAFAEKIRAELKRLHAQHGAKFAPGYTIDPAMLVAGATLKIPNVIVVAANARGEIVRYFELGETAAYFGSPFARDAATGFYAPAREQRRVASTGKILIAIALANEARDVISSLYPDALAPDRGGDTCERGSGATPGHRRAIVAFACSLNRPIEWRAAQLGQERLRRLIDALGFAMPPAPSASEVTPPSTAAVRGLISGSPRRVHHMLIGEGAKPVRLPTLVKSYDYTSRESALAAMHSAESAIRPNTLIRPHAHQLIKAFLQAPLCHWAGGIAHGTLKSLSTWCA
ncbi:MAG TPA: transglycosylase domain-containing protein, partial [Hyphomicrobiaceae bacterium]|nr:transglycosylase domain-containing protein [Hyphomicrobiaceae bacterium]